MPGSDAGQSRRRARIGVVGAGWWSTQAHLPSLTTYDAVEAVALSDLNADKLRAAGEAYGVRARYTDFQRMLDAEALDGVVVATNHAAHYDVAREALARNIGVMIEKPMVLRAREARELRRMAEASGAPLVVGYPWHFVEQHQRLRERIQGNALGAPQLVTSLFASMVLEFLRGKPEAYAPVFKFPVTGPGAATYSDPRLAGGGQGQLQVTHSAALALWLTGLKPMSVCAFMENHGLHVDLCDAISVRFEGGAIGTFASTGAVAAAQAAHQLLECRIFGAEGFAVLDVRGGRCALHLNSGETQPLADVPPEQRYPQAATARHLVDLLLGTAPVNVSPAEIGVRTVELLEAAYRSAQEGRAIHVSEL